MAATKEVNDLAAYIVGRLGRIETLKLQKLLYYCNAWALALRDKAMFKDEIQAWKHGPVVSSVYTAHKGDASVGSWEAGVAHEVPVENQDLASAVINLYGARSGWALRNLTHSEGPWQAAWERCGNGATYGEVITEEEMGAYYKELFETGQATGPV